MHDQYESGRRGRGICPVLQGHIDMQPGQHISTLAFLLRRRRKPALNCAHFWAKGSSWPDGRCFVRRAPLTPLKAIRRAVSACDSGLDAFVSGSWGSGTAHYPTLSRAIPLRKFCLCQHYARRTSFFFFCWGQLKVRDTNFYSAVIQILQSQHNP